MSALFYSALILLCVAATGFAAAAPGPAGRECVVLLHGLGRTSASMKRMEWHLRRNGYQVINATYPSTRRTIGELAGQWLPQLLAASGAGDAPRVHFVTHSMGGIIIRKYLADHQLVNLGRVVMLAPPNHGSEIVDFLRRHRLTRILLTPAHFELGTSPGDVPQKLGPVSFDCGVIAGDRSLNPLLSGRLTGPNDGKVTVASARVDGMAGFLVVHHSHTWLMWRKAVLEQTLGFLRTGRFESPAVGG